VNILIITYFSYKDGLTQAYTLPYIKQIRATIPKESKLHFTTLEQKHLLLTEKEKEAVERELKSESITVSFFKWKGSGAIAAISWVGNIFFLMKKVLFEKYDIIHAWNTPSGIFGYILSVLTGRKLVIDSYEPHAEPMVESGEWYRGSLRFKILFLFERLQSKRASLVIACVDKMKEYALTKYNVSFKVFLWKPACVDFEKFNGSKYNQTDEREKIGLKDSDIVCIYAGKFGGSYLEREVFQFFACCKENWANDFKVVLLGNHDRDFLDKLCDDVGLEHSTIKSYLVDHEDVPRYLSVGDFGLTPFVPVPSKRYGSPIKTGEYMAMGLPQIISKEISDDSELLDRSGYGFILDAWNTVCFKKAVNYLEEVLKRKNTDLSFQIRKRAMSIKSYKLSQKVYERYFEVLKS